MSFGNVWSQGLQFVKVYTFGAINFLDSIICFGSTSLLDLMLSLIFVCVFIPIVVNALPRDSVSVGSYAGGTVHSVSDEIHSRLKKSNNDNDDGIDFSSIG